MTPVRVHRLNPTDEMLHAASRNLGSSRVVQVVWRFAAPVSAGRLREEWERLDRGRLSRQVAEARVPGARRRWVAAANAVAPCVQRRTLTDETVMDWIDAQVRAPLQVGSDALWRLAAAPYGIGTLVSLTVPHFRADGLGMFAAIAAPPGLRRRPTAAGLVASDAADAARQAVMAAAGSVPWAAAALARPEERARLRAALAERPSGPPASAPRWFSTAILEVDARAWHQRAAALGGTANSLFVEVAANLVRARVAEAGRDTIQVGIPLSLRRSAADGRANALVVVPMDVPAGAPRYEDLRLTRGAVKAALESREGRRVTLVPEALWHLLPRRHADRLKVPGAQQTDVVASNFGRVPEGVAGFAGGRADSVALRTMNVPGLVPERARLRASLCLLEAGDRMTLTATGMPDCFGDGAQLRCMVAEELAAWGLRPEPWC